MIFSSVICGETLVRAEIQPDNTLGGEATRLTPGVEVKGATADIINGGAVRGANLFHSFREFSIGDGQRVYFTNPTGVENILTRVTGNNRSAILGTLGVLGNANLFLINPNGIIFGQNAKLDVGGSFVASTAESLLFDNGFAFSAKNPQVPALLTVNLPLGLQYGGKNAGIQVQEASLKVADGKTLALVGGTVEIDAAEVLALGGRIELGGIAETGTVEINNSSSNLSLGFPDRIKQADIAIANGTFMDVRAGGGGDIIIHADNANIVGGSFLRAGIASGQGSPTSQAGNIEINATADVVVEGAGNILNDVFEEGVGIGGDLTIIARSFSLLNGAQLSASTSGQGNAGRVTIQATDTVNFDGADSDGFASSAFSAVDRQAIGNGGSINIFTGALNLTNGAQLITRSNGQGDAGNVTIVARDRVVIDGRNFLGSSSGIYSRVNPGAIGQGGDIAIAAESLSITNGAQLSASTSSQKNAGNVIINTRTSVILDGEDYLGFPSGIFSRVNLGARGQGGMIAITAESVNVTNGAVMTTSTRGQGDAGSIVITARDRVFVDGVDLRGFPTTILSSVQPGATGNGKNIVIDSPILTVQNGARIAVGSQGKGVGGDIRIGTDFLTLDRQGAISAETASTTGGNITLNVPNLLLLRRGSSLSTTAGTAQAGGDGGNIAIAAGLIVASPTEDSNITADAFTGRGGNIDISTQGIFGIEFRDRQTSFSDITASSQFGVNGVVEINKPDADPNKGLVALPNNVVDADKLITQNCRSTGATTASQQSEFVVTGRGGLPPHPSQSLSSDAIWSDLQPHALLNQAVNSSQTQAIMVSPAPEAIVEAQGLVIGDGSIMLVAQAPSTTLHGYSLKPISCPIVSKSARKNQN